MMMSKPADESRVVNEKNRHRDFLTSSKARTQKLSGGKT
jgi:hypothetical protein